jgi:hypothetical protein
VQVRLSDRERALLLALLRQPAAGVPLGSVPRCVGWKAGPVSDVLAGLVAGRWVEIDGPLVRVSPWAAAWMDHEPSAGGRRWRPVDAGRRCESLDREPAGREPGREQAFVLTGADVVWRELHRRGCPCGACRDGAPPSGTRPRPGSCATCKGRPLPPLWECLRCGRGGRDAQRPPLPKVRNATPAHRPDGLKGGKG